MKPAEICMTLLLPTLVEPRSPTFSLFLQKYILVSSISTSIYSEQDNKSNLHWDSRTSCCAKQPIKKNPYPLIVQIDEFDYLVAVIKIIEEDRKISWEKG